MDGLTLDAPVQYLVEMHHLTLELQMWAFTHTLYAAQGLCGGSKLLVQSRTDQLHDYIQCISDCIQCISFVCLLLKKACS